MHVSSHLPEFLTKCKSIDFDSDVLQQALVLVIAAPLVWNIVARTLRNIIPTKAGMTTSFHKAVDAQPQSSFFPDENMRLAVCGVLFGLGQLFVLSSFYRLGVTGTFLGDYCGIFMNARVTGFPFSVLDNPMYVGSTMSFLAYSLWYGSWAGLLITVEVAIVYKIALMFEGPYTTQIYIERDQQRKANKKAQ